MVAVRHLTAKDGDVLLLVGTMKGAFVLKSNTARARWDVGGPYFPGHAVYALAYDGRAGRRKIWAGSVSEHWGAALQASDDFGKTWDTPERARIRFDETEGASVKRIWQIQPGRSDEPDVLYCGIEPAALFRSSDGGRSWSMLRGLHDHPHRPQWQPGGGGLCLHTIIADPSDRQRLLVAISTGGVYRSDDDGRTWQARNSGIRAEFLPDKYPEFGQCVHKVVQHPSRPERLFLQNHWGLYRSDDSGDSWRDIARPNVPSDFGFCMAIHPHDADTVYVLPIESDEFRCTPAGKLRVYRTRDAGDTWEPLTRGLPQKNALETVLRDAMALDRLNPAGVYFGTRNGQVFGSSNGGTTWRVVLEGLPPVVCVKAAVVGDPAKARSSGRAAGRKPAAQRAKPSGARKRRVAARSRTGARPALRPVRRRAAAKKK